MEPCRSARGHNTHQSFFPEVSCTMIMHESCRAVGFTEVAEVPEQWNRRVPGAAQFLFETQLTAQLVRRPVSS